MADAGSFHIDSIDPTKLRKKFLANANDERFNLICYCCYDFPTEKPDQIKDIFGPTCWEKQKESTLSGKILPLEKSTSGGDYINEMSQAKICPLRLHKTRFTLNQYMGEH